MKSKSLTGQYRHKVTFRIPTGTEIDGVPQYTNGAMVWASVEPLRGREFIEAMAVQAENTVRIRMRYLPGIKPDWRIRFVVNDPTYIDYDIITIIDPGMMHRTLEIMCRAVE